MRSTLYRRKKEKSLAQSAKPLRLDGTNSFIVSYEKKKDITAISTLQFFTLFLRVQSNHNRWRFRRSPISYYRHKSRVSLAVTRLAHAHAYKQAY